MKHRSYRYACVAVVSLLLLSSQAPAPADTGASGGVTANSSKEFLEKAKKLRAPALRQAMGCEGLSPADQAECKAFRPTGRGADAPPYAPDRVIVKFTGDAKPSRSLSTVGSRVDRSLRASGVVAAEVPEGNDPVAFARKLSKIPGVEYAEPDFTVRSLADPPETVDWGVRAIKADEAATTNNVTGDGVTVAIVDTGIDYTHKDLDANIAVNAAEDDGDGIFEPNGAGDNDGIDDDLNGFVDDVVGYDFIGANGFGAITPDNDPMDAAGHGTHVAGIVAAEDNTIGVRGVAPDATLLPVKVLDDFGGGFDSTVADGIYYAVDNGADIINMSLGTYGRSSTLRQAIEYAHAAGVAVVAAAGNLWFYSLPLFPAGYPDVISVSAASDLNPASDDELLTKVWWSDWGHTDFLAPGDQILSTTPDNTYSAFSGTSMASPHVAGALALVREKGVSSSKLEQALAATATDVYFDDTDEVSGHGVPNALAATSALSDQVVMYRDRYLIPADGATGSTITLRMLDGTGNPIVGENVAWSSDLGSLTDLDTATDGNGEAQATLTIDDFFGAVTVTADPAAHDAQDLRIIVEDDRVHVDDAHLVPDTDEFDDCFDYYYCEAADDGPGTFSAAPQLGDDVVLRVYLGQHDFAFDSDRVAVTWEIENPDGDVLSEVSGELEPVTVFCCGSQSVFESDPMTMPLDEPGSYHMTVEATTLDNAQTHTFEKDFLVGVDSADVLLINHSESFDVETFNYFSFYQTDSPVRHALEGLGKSVVFWDPDVHGTPSIEDLASFPAVIWLDGFFGGGFGNGVDLDTVEEYIDMGGNILVGSKQLATNSRFSSSETKQYRRTLGATGLLTTFFPDENHQQNPASVEIVNTTLDSLDPFEGVYGLSPYDLNHPNESTSIFTDELKRYVPSGFLTLGEYPSGVHATGGFEAATVKEDDTSRVVSLGFGLESIDGDIGPLLDGLLGFFAPAMSISTIDPAKVTNKRARTIAISGEGFQAIGLTRVLLDGAEVESVVLSHGEIEFSIPKKFPVGVYDVTVENPDGQTDTSVNGFEVVKKL